MKLWVICILECVMWVIRKIGCFMWKYSVLVKIRESLLCVTNRCIKVTSKLILSSVSRFKFCPYFKNRVKHVFQKILISYTTTVFRNQLYNNCIPFFMTTYCVCVLQLHHTSLSWTCHKRVLRDLYLEKYQANMYLLEWISREKQLTL